MVAKRRESSIINEVQNNDGKKKKSWKIMTQAVHLYYLHSYSKKVKFS